VTVGTVILRACPRRGLIQRNRRPRAGV